MASRRGEGGRPADSLGRQIFARGSRIFESRNMGPQIRPRHAQTTQG